jgi:predicted transposase YbfD/YdcC
MAAKRSLAIITLFEDLTDPRVERTKLHQLNHVISIALLAVIANANSWAAMARFAKAREGWLTRVLGLTNGVPSAWTFMRVLQALDPKAFAACLESWLSTLAEIGAGTLIAFDGKRHRGSGDPKSCREALHTVAAWASEQNLFLGQEACADKSNEITAIPKLLEILELAGAIVTIDAIGCQKEITAKIAAAKADFVIAVKDNQPKLHAAVADAFADANDDAPRKFVTVEKSRGRHERREYSVLPVPVAIAASGDWAHIKSIGMVYTERTVKGVTAHEIRYYISSLEPQVKRFARAVRGHWGIENRFHWVLDVTFAEDACKIHKRNAPENFGLMRRLALMILRQDTTLKGSLKGKRETAAYSEKALEGILINISP